MNESKNFSPEGIPEDNEVIESTATDRLLPTVEEKYGPRTSPRQFNPDTVKNFLDMI